MELISWYISKRFNNDLRPTWDKIDGKFGSIIFAISENIFSEIYQHGHMLKTTQII